MTPMKQPRKGILTRISNFLFGKDKEDRNKDRRVVWHEPEIKDKQAYNREMEKSGRQFPDVPLDKL